MKLVTVVVGEYVMTDETNANDNVTTITSEANVLLQKLIDSINEGKYDFSVTGETDSSDEEKAYLQFVAFNRETALRNSVEEVVGASHLPLFAKHALWNGVWRPARKLGLDAKQTFDMYKSAAMTAIKCRQDGVEEGTDQTMVEVIHRDAEYVATKDVKHLFAITDFGGDDDEDGYDDEGNDVEGVKFDECWDV